MREPWDQYRFEQMISGLIEANRTANPPNCGWADYEIEAIRGARGMEAEATDALGFAYEFFGMRDSQAVSCDICGGLFRESNRRYEAASLQVRLGAMRWQ